jgi:Rrf2 family protein
MKLSAKAEYACAAMMELAASSSDTRPVRIKAIADAHGIDQHFLVQVLLQLKTAGLVRSVRGAAGGYQLARRPEQITLAAILDAVGGRPKPPASALGRGASSPAAEVLLGVWREVHAQEQRLLEGTTLADLVRRMQEKNALSYQI